MNKIDSITTEKKLKIIEKLKQDFEEKFHENIICISAVTGENFDKLKQFLYQKVKNENSEY